MKSETAIERVRRICLSLPDATEKEAWGEPTFRVRDKLFAMYADAGNHHGAGSDSLWLNAPMGLQEHLVRADPDLYFVPPYVGVKGWIGVRIDRIDDDELLAHCADSYAMVAPKRLLSALEEMLDRAAGP